MRAASWAILFAVIEVTIGNGVGYGQSPTPPSPQELPWNSVPDRPVGPPPRIDPPLFALPPVSFPSESGISRRTIGGPPGYFFDLDLALLFPDLRTRYGNDGLFGRSTDFGLDVDVSPTFTFGYNFNSLNSILMSYRYFGTEGSPNVDDNATSVRTRLDINDINWTYQRWLRLPWDRNRFAVEAGARLSSIYYDFDMNSTYPTFAPAGSDYQVEFRGSTHFVGAGPTIGLANDFEIIPGMSFFGRSDFAPLFGQQTFRHAVQSSFPGSTPYFSGDSEHRNNTVKVLRAAAGLNWAPDNMPHVAVQMGYQFEYWWDIGRFADAHDDLMLNGLFARVRFTY